MFKKIFGIIIGLGLTTGIYAANNGAYVGASIAHTNLDYTTGNQNLSPGSRDNNSGTGWSGFIGYQMNRNFALQADYIKYHDVNFNNILGVTGADATYKQDAGDVVGKLIFPLGNGFNVFATGGLAYVQLNRDTNSTAKALNITMDDKHALRPTYGLGAAYDFYPGWTVQVNWSQIPSGGSIEQSNYLGAGLSFNFG